MNTRQLTIRHLDTIIEVQIEDDMGTITSNLKTDDPEDDEYNAAMDGLESLILAHALAGIDIESEEYAKGVITAVESCANNL